MELSTLSNKDLTIDSTKALEALSFSEKEGLYSQVDKMVDLLDERCMGELFSGTKDDIYSIFDIILEETYNVLNLKKYNTNLGGFSLEQLPYVKSGFEEYLRKENLNYFVHSVLPHFEMNWSNIEWFQMAQLYRLLCIEAARDHSKSYSWSFAYPLWRLYRYTRPTSVINPPDEIKFYKEGMIITNEFKLAKKLLKKIKEEIQINPILSEALYPEKNIGGWANESITCKTGAEITLSSFRTSNRGPHPGWIVVDDFLDKSAIYSKEQREKFVDVFNSEIMNMILPQGQIIVVGCVSPETIILSKDNGFQRMGSLVEYDKDRKQILNYKDKIQDIKGFSETEKFFSNGYGKMRRIIGRGGYNLDCSLIHPLRKMGEDGVPTWTKSSDLKVGDWIGIKRNLGEDFGKEISLLEFKREQQNCHFNTVKLNLPDFLDEDLCYLIGLWIAEGSLYKDNSGIEISSRDEEIGQFLFSLKEKYGVIFKGTEKFNYVCTNKQLCLLFRFLGLNSTHCNLKRIPDLLLGLKKKLLSKILSGLFDGDGSCCLVKDNLEVSLSSTSKVLIETVQSILLMGWGIKSNKVEISLEKLKAQNKKYGNSFECNFPQLTLSLNDNFAVRFCREIGFGLSRKQENFKKLKKTYFERDYIPFQFPLYNKINKERLSKKLWYGKDAPREVKDIYSIQYRETCDKKRLKKIVDYWKKIGITNGSLKQLEENCSNEISWIKIKSIEDVEGYSVDFVIPETHSFVTNGIISHNTPFHEKDLYAILKEDPQWHVFEYPAIFPDGSILWDNRYNFEALKAKRITLGSMVFSREILVRPVSDATSIFPWSILETAFVNMGNICLVENRASYPIKLKKVAIGVDWALSANAAADYTEMCVGGVDELDQIHLLALVSLHGAGYNEQIATLQRLNSNFSPEVILVETNGFQKVMAGLARESGLVNIVEEVTTASSKKDIYNGLPSLAVFFEQGKFKFPRGDERSKNITNALCSQLNSIAFDDDKGTLEGVGEHDDKVMALFFMVKGLRYNGEGFKISMI